MDNRDNCTSYLIALLDSRYVTLFNMHVFNPDPLNRYPDLSRKRAK